MNIAMKNALIGIALTAVFSNANATALADGVITANVDVSAFFGGTLLNSATTSISNASYSGTATTAVYDTGSGLDFYYQFSNNSNSINGIERFSGFNFSSLGASIVDVYQTGTGFGGIFTNGTEKADNADRTTLGVIGFNFLANANSKINPNTTSYIEIIRTNARSYTAGNFGLLDGIGDNARGFAPTAAVPEPETYAMMMAGLGLIGFIARRRRNNG